MKLFINDNRIKPLSAYQKDLLQQVIVLSGELKILNEAHKMGITSKTQQRLINDHHDLILSMMSVVLKYVPTEDFHAVIVHKNTEHALRIFV